MIEYKKGNIFGEDVEALVNTVNCVGIMGRGLAQFTVLTRASTSSLKIFPFLYSIIPSPNNTNLFLFLQQF